MKVIIGYDHRCFGEISSERLALIAASVFLRSNIGVVLYNRVVCTQMVPFGIENCENAICGIMITASHNPKQDNGYKLYWTNGVQIISPIDENIALEIANNLKPWHKYNWSDARNKCIDLTEVMVNKYITKATETLCFTSSENQVKLIMN